MKIISSELYVKDNKVYHEGNKPKPKDIGAAPETHTHNYASATTPGGSAEHAIKATEDSLGQRIDKYIKGLSVSGRTITYTRGDGTTGTITTQDNDTDTKVTNTLNITAKAYITGTTNSATNTGTQVFDTNVYLDTTAGMLTATTFKGALQGNATTATSATSASHAAKLTTPRSINGTNFDGTAAITTANWGTARTLTIGNTGKSVNGSGNVSWSIGEIGAAPTVHNHTSLTGITNLSFATEGTDSASIKTTVDGTNTYFDFNLSDDPSQNDMWRWRFGPSGANIFNAMTLDAISTTEAKLAVTGEVQATRLKGTLTGDVKGNVTGTVSGNAGSATKLATARTINGTNFDGTGNITTANWGTARNIQIGNTSKSVNGSANISWTLDEVGAASRSPFSNTYKQITVGGDANTYYPVLITMNRPGIGYPWYNISISRAYNATAPDTWNTATHRGGLTFQFRWSGDTGWGGNDHNLQVVEFHESYTTMVAGFTLSVSGIVVWLRGGGALYQLNCEQGIGINATVTLGTYTSADDKTYPVRTNTNSVANEIHRLWVQRGGEVYDNNSRVYSANNKPTPAAIGALSLSGGTMTGPIKFNSSVTSSDASAPTQLAHGLLGSYSNLKILANTDNNAGADNEYVHIAAARGLSPDTNQGIVVYGTYANAFGSRIVTEASGTAKTAVKLATARTIALGGILSGSASFDGSGNVTINATANDITTITKSLNVTTSWMDTGITGSNLATGTYAVQMHINDGTNTGHYNEYYSGIVSWFADGTNSTDADEILLHKAGHAPNGRHVYLRTIRTGNSGRLKLQISCTHAFSAASNITFKFKKLI